MSELLRIAVVGHTNTGKTSLLRTLARDVAFGEVSNRPSTTRGVTEIGLLVDGQDVVRFADTPGLEDSIGLLELLDRLRDRSSARAPGGSGDASRLDGPAQIEAFLKSPEATARFAPEAMALRALLECDAGIYVIDSRDRVLPKHRDELEVLSRTGRPIVPLLNFIAAADPQGGGSNVLAWRDTLSRINLHAVVEFDTVVFDQEGETRLFQKLQTLLDRHRQALERLIVDRRMRQERLRRSAVALVARLLADAATAVEIADRPERSAIEAAETRLRDRIRSMESRAVRDLLALFQFLPSDCVAADLPLVDGAWGLDLFSPAELKRQGLGAGGGAAAGAAAGAVIDLAVGGMSLGAAAGLGALVGATLGGLGVSGRRLVRRARGGNELRVGDATLRILGRRELELVRALLRRGHASVEPVRVGSGDGASRSSVSDRGSSTRPTDPRRDDPVINEAIAALRRDLLPDESASPTSWQPAPVVFGGRETTIEEAARFLDAAIR